MELSSDNQFLAITYFDENYEKLSINVMNIFTGVVHNTY